MSTRKSNIEAWCEDIEIDGMPICLYSLVHISLGCIMLDLTRKKLLLRNPAAEETLEKVGIPVRFKELREEMVVSIMPQFVGGVNRVSDTIARNGYHIGYTVHWVDNNIVFILLNDVTEREQEQRKFVEIHGIMHLLLESAPYAVLLIDADGRVEFANEAATRMGLSEQMRFTQREPIIIDDSVKTPLLRLFQDTLKKGVASPRFRAEYVSRDDDAPRLVFLTILPITTTDGQRIMLMMEDVTEQMELEFQKDLLSSVLEASPTQFAITDRHGQIQYLNPAFKRDPFMFVDDPDEDDLSLSVGDDPKAESWRAARNAIQAEQPWNGRLTQEKTDGSSSTKEVYIYPVKVVGPHSTKEMVNFAVSSTDVTERVRLENIAEAVNLGDNLGTIALGLRHEIGNPLNILKMNLSLIEDHFDQLARDKLLSYIGRSLGAVERIEVLLRELKNFNIHEKPFCESVVLEQFCRHFEKMAFRSTGLRGIRFQTIVHPEAEQAYFDPRAMQHVMLNLLNNALDALEDRPDPTVTLVALHHNQGVTLRITDNGCGMSKETRRQVFDPFFTTKAAASGLGLTISKKLLASMNCLLTVDSVKGGGTIVEIHCPVAKTG